MKGALPAWIYSAKIYKHTHSDYFIRGSQMAVRKHARLSSSNKKPKCVVRSTISIAATVTVNRYETFYAVHRKTLE